MANREQHYRYKGYRCNHCGLSVQQMVDQYGTFNRMFQLNHVDPKKKHRNYENLIRRKLSTEQLDEVDKCILLCNQCHGVLHAQNITAEAVLRITIGNKTAEQRMKGQIIFDKIKRRMRFLSNERLLLHPYQVHLGDNPPTMLFGIELRNGELVALIRKIADHKRIIITNSADLVMLQIEHLGGGEIKAEQDISFPILDYELHRDKGDPVHIWVRNGVGLTKGGEVIDHGMLTWEGNAVNW
jgi:hypothetical protein